MDKFTELTLTEAENINGGTYYGNGVHCGKHTCSVNWGEAWSEGVKRWGDHLFG